MGTAVIITPLNRNQGNHSIATITITAIANDVLDERIRGSCQKIAPQFTWDETALIASPAAKKATPIQPIVRSQGYKGL